MVRRTASPRSNTRSTTCGAFATPPSGTAQRSSRPSLLVSLLLRVVRAWVRRAEIRACLVEVVSHLLRGDGAHVQDLLLVRVERCADEVAFLQIRQRRLPSVDPDLRGFFDGCLDRKQV